MSSKSKPEKNAFGSYLKTDEHQFSSKSQMHFSGDNFADNAIAEVPEHVQSRDR